MLIITVLYVFSLSSPTDVEDCFYSIGITFDLGRNY